MSYSEYYASPSWAKKRRQRLEIDNHECRFCGEDGTRYHLEVHHKPQSYAKIPNESVEDDLTTVCTRCHDFITSRIRERRNDKHGDRKVEFVEPVAITGEHNHGLENKDLSIEFVDAVVDAQWTTGSPTKQVVSFDERDYIEEKQDRRGL